MQGGRPERVLRRRAQGKSLANVHLRTQQQDGTATSATSIARAAKTRHQPRSAKSSRRRFENEMKWKEEEKTEHFIWAWFRLLCYAILYYTIRIEIPLLFLPFPPLSFIHSFIHPFIHHPPLEALPLLLSSAFLLISLSIKS